MRRKQRLVFQVHQTKTLAAPRPPYHYKGTALQRAGSVQVSGTEIYFPQDSFLVPKGKGFCAGISCKKERIFYAV